MAKNVVRWRASNRGVELLHAAKKAGAPRPVGANDPARRLRLDVLESLAPTMLHELSQPLAATSAYLDLCTAKVRERIDGLEDLLATIVQAKAQAARMAAIIRSMRNFALSGEVARQPEELRQIASDALAAVPGISEVDVQLRYHAASVYVIADRVQLGQVLINLFTNAVEAMADCPAKRLILETSASGDGTLIRIEDNGPGMSLEVASRLYEPFVTTKPDGTGLGLPICNTIIEAHDGRLWADQPEAGRGLTMNILIPARIVREKE